MLYMLPHFISFTDIISFEEDDWYEIQTIAQDQAWPSTANSYQGPVLRLL